MILSSVCIFVCHVPQDMRRSFDGLALAARQELGDDLQGGAPFVFTNIWSARIKVRGFDRNGCCLLYKRLHKTRFELPEARVIDGTELGRVLRRSPTSRSDANCS